MKTITVILNGFKRQHTLKEQITALKNQTYPIEKIMYWNLKDPSFKPDYKLLEKENIEYADTSHDYGTWGRLSFAMNATTDFVCIMDDDVIPGPRYLENCINTYQKTPGVLGMMGSGVIADKQRWFHYG